MTNTAIDLYIRRCEDSSASPTASGATGTGTGGTGTGTGGVICYEEDDRRYFGATERTSPDTRQECEDDCTATSNCVAIGFDSGNNRCWQHTSQSDLDGRSDTLANYRTYVRGNCACGYETEEDKQYYGAVEFSSADTVAECQAECDRDSDCVGFGVDGNNNNRCWIHKEASQIESGARSDTRSNYDTYKKGANCPGGTGTPTGTPTGGCTNAYIIEEGRRYIGGSVSSTSNTESACQSACNGNSACLGFGYHSTASTGSRCWLHLRESDFNSGSQLANYDTWRRNQNCPTGVTTGCTIVYTSESRQYFGATQRTSADTRNECEDICDQDSACVGFGFSTQPNPDQCWIHINSNDFNGNSRTFTGYTTYRKSESCTTGTGTGTGGCVPTYDEFEGSYSLGGTQVTDSGVDTEDECLDWCTARSECGAVDFNTQNRCFWHSNGNWQNQLRTGGSGVSQFRKQGCDSSASPTGGTGGTGDTGGTGCVDTFNSMVGKFGSGGQRRANADTVAECESACNSMTRSNCVGFDFNRQDNSCWLHNNANVFNQLQDNSQITNYERIPCTTSTCAFTRNQNVQSFGATQSPSSSGQAACESRCRAESSCVAYDIDKTNNNCWIHTNAGDLTNTEPNNNFDHYVKDENCDTTGGTGRTGTGSTARTGPTPCAVTYMKEENTLAFNGVRLASANTEPMCRDACSANRACFGFDFDRNNNQCWQHLNAANNEDSNKQSSNGVDHYEKDENCPLPPDPCRDTFEAFVGTHAYDGTYISTADTVDECQNSCLNNAECLALDFNGGCYIHTNRANLANLNNNAVGVTHYIRRENNNPACNRQTTRMTTEDCSPLDSYSPVRRNFVHSSYQSSTDPPLDQTGPGQALVTCQALCNGMADCRAFVRFTSTGVCIFYGSVGEAQPLTGFDYYRRRNSCDDDECPPVTERTENRGSNGGQRIPLANTLNECLTGCVQDTTCAGIDYLQNADLNSRCFQHTSQTISRHRPDSASVQFVITQRDSCQVPTTPAPSGPCQMILQPNSQQEGGQVLMSAGLPLTLTPEECQNRCRQDVRCKSVDYNPSFNACFVHYVDGVIVSSANVHHYTKRCPACFETFVWRQNQEPIAQTGVLVSADDPSECAVACFNNPLCDAFTFQSSGDICRHYLRVGQLQENQIRSRSGVDLHMRSSCDPVPTAPPTSQPPSGTCIKLSYQTLVGFALFQVPGTPAAVTAPSNINTAAACQVFCSNTPSCFGVQFQPSTCQYFTHRQFAQFMTGTPGLVSYRAQCQGDPLLPTLPPTQPPTRPPTQPPTQLPNNNCRIAASMASGAFFPALGTQGIGQKIPMQRSLANRFNNLRPPSASTWTDIVNPDGCPSALHFVCIGAGALSSQGVRVELTGTYNFNTAGGIRSYPISVQRQDTSHRGPDTLDRCLIVQSQSQFSLTLRQGVAYSDGIGFLTGLSVFSLSDWSAADGSNFMVGRRTPFTCAAPPCDIQFQTTNSGLLNPYLVVSNSYDRITDTYTCPSSGDYLFSWTYGGPATSPVRVSLRRVSNTRGTASWSSDRLSTGTNGVDTISKTVIINCQGGERVNLRLEQGSTMSNQYVLTSFSGFKYEPANLPASQRVAWFATMSNDVDLQQVNVQLTNLIFDNVEVNQGSAYNPATGEFTVPYAGTYLIYASAGLRAGRFISVYARRSTAPVNSALFGLHRLHTGHNGNDQLGRATIVTLTAGERVFVNSLQGSAIRGGQGATSFGGMLLYRT